MIQAATEPQERVRNGAVPVFPAILPALIPR